MSNNKNIGIITLCGLIIGPILGSGIVLLPPMAYRLIGKWSIAAWIIIMLLGIVFAYVFIFLSLKSPGNEGVAIAVGNTLGNFWRELTSNFLMTAVCFGPVAVLITASDFLKGFVIFSSIKVEIIAFGIEIICAAILIAGVKTLGKFTLILTGFTAILLLCGSVYSLLFASSAPAPQTTFSFSKFGYTLLLLFWAIVGWEVVGNYVEDIKNPKETLMKAMTISLIIIVGLYTLVALSMQNASGGSDDITAIMYPLFGTFSKLIMGIVASGLCISTYLMIVGAVTRMTAMRAVNNRLPIFLSKINKKGSPISAIITFISIHALVLALTSIGILNLDSLVTCANVFFLCNALIGLMAGFKLLNNIKLRAAIIVLIVSFTLLLFKANSWSIALLIMITLISLYKTENRVFMGIFRTFHL